MSSEQPDSVIMAQIAACRDLWPLASAAQQVIFNKVSPSMSPILQAHNLQQRGLTFALIQANLFAPGPVSGERIQERFPFSAPHAWEKLLVQLLNLGYLDRAQGVQQFVLNQAGQAAYNAFRDGLDALLAPLNHSFQIGDLAELIQLLAKIIAAALDADHLAGGGHHLRRFWGKRPAGLTPLHDIDYLLDCLNAYRDDAHLTSFQPLDIPGYTWELFTFIWRGQLTDIVDLADRLGPFRGYDARTYHQGLMELVGKGWVRLNEGGPYQLTEEGLAIRETAEAETDHDFYRPWLVLSDAETNAVRRHLTAIRDTLGQ